ncbi:MAG: hypothetical protein HC804_12590 [Anaerolineae bacterium]|nr:hypothetical protein [Anaerolineae bacterium]
MTHSIPMQKPVADVSPWHIWRQWVAANSLAEVIGLGGSALIGALLFQWLGETAVSTLILAVVMILCGTFMEGVLVGLLQWHVLQRPFPSMSRTSWVRATAVGAAVAWTLGMIPSTVMNLTADTSSTPPTEPSNLVVYGLAAAMGLLLGPILALPQWTVLRHYVKSAGWWIPANSLAWAGGMIIVFMGTSLIPPEGITPGIALLLLVTLAVAGAVVGAVHGLALVWFLRSGE